MSSQGGFDAARFREAVLAVVCDIPPGKVASYGQVALLAGYARRARQVGMTLRGLPPGTDVPWHRVLSASGLVPSRGRWADAMEQIERLRAEGVEVAPDGSLPLRRYRWCP